MSDHAHTTQAPARTHAEAAALFRRPFAPGAIGFRAMTKVAFNGVPYAGAQVAAYLGAQSVVQRLNAVVPGRWRQAVPIGPGRACPRRDAADLLCRLRRGRQCLLRANLVLIEPLPGRRACC
jgi:hypothetical protein